MSEFKCQQELMSAGMPYPRTCEMCGLFGPCRLGFKHLEHPSEREPHAATQALDDAEREVLANVRAAKRSDWSENSIAEIALSLVALEAAEQRLKEVQGE